MGKRNPRRISKEALAVAEADAEMIRKQLARLPNAAAPLTTDELVDAAPFYLVLRRYIRQLKEARESGGLTLADVSARTGIAIESLSRLETGAQTNPTWKTLGLYTVAVDRQPLFQVSSRKGRKSQIQKGLTISPGMRFPWDAASGRITGIGNGTRSRTVDLEVKTIREIG